MKIARPYAGEMYKPMPPTADSPELCAIGERVILRHTGCGTWREASLLIVPKDVMYSGWVIGTNPTKQN